MKKEQPSTIEIIGGLKEYAKTHLKLAKYKAIEKGASIAADMIAEMVMILFYAIALFFASITLAFYLAGVFSSHWAGFGCLGLLYLLVALFVIVFKKRFEQPIINVLINKLLNL